MNKLPLDIEENFQDAQLYQAFLMATRLLEQAESSDMREIAEQSLEAILIAWHTATNPTEN
jgi:hypothetical protein